MGHRHLCRHLPDGGGHDPPAPARGCFAVWLAEYPASIKTWAGPGITAPDVDWLGEYPRCHLLSSGRLFFSGYAPRWATVDHDGAQPGATSGPGQWTLAAGQTGQPPGTYSSTWQDLRHDGTSVLFPSLGGQGDIVVRLGGKGASGATTATMESIDTTNSTDWVQEHPMPVTGGLPDGSRTNANVVILPSGGLLVLGGVCATAGGPQFALAPMLFEDGKWTVLAPNPVASPRPYHSTAVLLPDGRVFIGGGDDRTHDYEIFTPPGFGTPTQRPRGLVWQSPAPPFDTQLGVHQLAYATSYRINCNPLPLGQSVTRAVLIAPGSTTHHSDMSQRHVEMRTNVARGNQVQFVTPASELEAPPGLYMLFLLTNAPAHSEAIWVRFL